MVDIPKIRGILVSGKCLLIGYETSLCPPSVFNAVAMVRDALNGARIMGSMSW